MNGRMRRRALRHAFRPGEPLTQLPAQTPPERKPDRKALFQAMLDSGQARNRAELAQFLARSRAWVTKVLGAGAE